MRIIQITDLHINTANEPVKGIDTRANFKKTIKETLSLKPDMLVLTGDLSLHSGSAEVYQWIKNELEVANIKNYRIIGGNHDNIAILAEVFGLQDDVYDDELYYFIEPDFFFLDTAKGYCNSIQLEWFKDRIDSLEVQVPIIFMHHPPFKAGVPHMDKSYAFLQSDIFKDICLQSRIRPYVFCGHYHNEITLIEEGISVFITPSTYLQIGKDSDKFEIDHKVPAYRIIDLEYNSIKTMVRYVFDK